jgi:hypothetical protein
MHAPTQGEPTLSVAVGETRHQHLLRTGKACPRFLQGVYPFVGRGVYDLSPLDDALTYAVPEGKTAQVVYFRAGNLSDDLLYLTLTADSAPIRYFPIGPKGDVHVALAIVETHPAGTRLEVCLAAPRGLNGTVVVDVGIIEVAREA